MNKNHMAAVNARRSSNVSIFYSFWVVARFPQQFFAEYFYMTLIRTLSARGVEWWSASFPAACRLLVPVQCVASGQDASLVQRRAMPAKHWVLGFSSHTISAETPLDLSHVCVSARPARSSTSPQVFVDISANVLISVWLNQSVVYVWILTILKFQSILELFSTAHKLDRLFHPNRFPTDYSLSLFVNFVDAP